MLFLYIYTNTNLQLRLFSCFYCYFSISHDCLSLCLSLCVCFFLTLSSFAVFHIYSLFFIIPLRLWCLYIFKKRINAHICVLDVKMVKFAIQNNLTTFVFNAFFSLPFSNFGWIGFNGSKFASTTKSINAQIYLREKLLISRVNSANNIWMT